ncbi:MAG: alpha/beta hydrolase [Coriobacteriales bacterium]|nr:alpha/beta hydrolase [Coriobacteriales bacterium]
MLRKTKKDNGSVGQKATNAAYFTLANGEKLYYEDTATGNDVLVMMHGWTSTHAVYDKPVELLKGKARCITYDHRGHGASKDANGDHVTMETLASDLHELLVGLSLDAVTLVGWSMGAGVAMTYLEMFGTERLRQVVLCDMTPKQLNDDEWKLGLYQGAFTAQDEANNAGKSFYQLYKEFAIGAMPKLKKVPGFLLRRPLKKRLATCDEGVLRSLSVSMKGQDHRGCFAGFDIPLSYFYAYPGSLFSPELASWYQQNVPSSYKSVRFDDATHMLIEEQPQKFADQLAALL